MEAPAAPPELPAGLRGWRCSVAEWQGFMCQPADFIFLRNSISGMQDALRASRGSICAVEWLDRLPHSTNTLHSFSALCRSHIRVHIAAPKLLCCQWPRTATGRVRALWAQHLARCSRVSRTGIMDTCGPPSAMLGRRNIRDSSRASISAADSPLVRSCCVQGLGLYHVSVA